MTGFLAGVGGKLAERWLSRLALPGAVYAACVAVALLLGQSAVPFDFDRLADEAARSYDDVVGARPGAQAAAAVGAVLTAVFAGFAAQLLARGVRAWWFGRTGARWPLRTSMSRSMEQVQQRVSDFYALDLARAWPRLWLVLPERVRGEVRAAVRAVDGAVVCGGWGVAYLALGLLWWPAAVVGLATLLTGWQLARERTNDMAALVESAVDVGIRPLARAMGRTLPPEDASARKLGAMIAPYLHKRAPSRAPDTGPLPPPGPPVRNPRG
ncbi:hypothetical protein G5C51_29440 [Streptomyces sp. A7024]|uniref:Uncharacterized protein n=1 Tax=Streptomyces coryli TaxID=1128680 RepID=A0A6G4U9Z7_9ACTN|nr:hypothetical protein [Streptomyces coryli]NGN68011.1 hypothetical protein [Streptomyces coryli]